MDEYAEISDSAPAARSDLFAPDADIVADRFAAVVSSSNGSVVRFCDQSIDVAAETNSTSVLPEFSGGFSSDITGDARLTFGDVFSAKDNSLSLFETILPVHRAIPDSREEDVLEPLSASGDVEGPSALERIAQLRKALFGSGQSPDSDGSIVR